MLQIYPYSSLGTNNSKAFLTLFHSVVIYLLILNFYALNWRKLYIFFTIVVLFLCLCMTIKMIFLNKKYYILFYFLFVASISFSQSEVQFFKTLKTSLNETGHSIVKGLHKNYFVAGIIARGGEDFFIANYDLQGNLIWSKYYSSPITEQGDGVFLENTYDGGVFFGGYSRNMSGISIVKTDKNGTKIYDKIISVAYGQEVATSAVTLESGGAILSGYTLDRVGLDPIDARQILLKVDENGIVQWLVETSEDNLGYYSSEVLLDNKAILTSGLCTDGTNESSYLIKNDSVGSFVWGYKYQGSGNDRLNKIIKDYACGYVGIGTTSDKLTGKSDILFVKFDGSGNVVASKRFGGSGKDVGSHIIKSYDGNYVIGGSSSSFSTDNSLNLFLMKIDTLGNVLWTQSYGDSMAQLSIENTSMFVQEADSTFVLTGVDSKTSSGRDLLFIKTAKHGVLDCYSNSASSFALDYPLIKIGIQADTFIDEYSDQPNNLTLMNSIFVENLNCRTIPSTTCGLNANFDYFQNCGSGKVYFSDRSLGAASTYTVSVSFGDGNSYTADQNTGFFSHEYQNTGFYTLNFSISSGNCISSVSKTIYSFNPFGSWSRKSFFCTADSLLLSLPKDMNTEYIWRDRANNFLSGDHQIKVLPKDSSWYYVTAIDKRNCCTLEDSVLVIPKEIQEITLGNDTMICKGDSIILEIQGDYQHVIGWQDASKKTIFVAKDTGLYYVSVMTNCGVMTDSIEISGIGHFSDFIQDTLICDADTFNVDVNVSNADILWSNGDSMPNTQFFVEGQYSVTVAFSESCLLKDSAMLRFLDSPTEVLDDTSFLCANNVLTVDVGIKDGEYLWNTGETTPSISVSSPGLYLVKVENDCGVQMDSTFVMSLDVEELLFDTSTCDLDSINLDASGMKAQRYLWSNQDTLAYTTIEESGIYFVEGYFDNCVVRDSVEVNLYQSPDIDFGNDTSTCGDYTLHAYADGASYLWQNGSTSSEMPVTETGTYTVRVSNLCGVSTDEIYVEVKDCKIIIPNVFTPNSDGINDEFMISADYGNWQLYIYDRWGIVVHQSDNIYLTNWNGRGAKGERCPEAIYYVILKRLDGAEVLNSTVFLKR